MFKFIFFHFSHHFFFKCQLGKKKKLSDIVIPDITFIVKKNIDEAQEI
jgi:hypothetical protein